MTDAKFKPSVVNMTTASAALSESYDLLRGVHVQAALSAEDLDFSDGAGGEVLFTVPASSPAGAWFEAGDMYFLNGIYVNSTAVTSGIVTVNHKKAA